MLFNNYLLILHDQVLDTTCLVGAIPPPSPRYSWERRCEVNLDT